LKHPTRSDRRLTGTAMCLAGVLMLVNCHNNNLDFSGAALTGGATGSGGDPGTGGAEVVPETGGRSGYGGAAGMSRLGTGGILGSGGIGTGGMASGGTGSGGTGRGGTGMGTGGWGIGGVGGRGAGGIVGVVGIGSCRTEPDCAALGLHCFLTPPQPTGRCVECLGDGMGHCPAAPRVRCDNGLHRCVECSTNVACPAGRCNTTEFRCASIPCGSSCPANLTCHDGTFCTECEVGDDSSPPCASGLSCTNESLCIGCTVDTQCPTAPRRRCDAIRGLCVQCRVATDCPSGFCNERTGVCL
jgi:hypothetical protein